MADKGAFDAWAVRVGLHGRMPENALAGHDLFDGLHGRAAPASDIVFYEGFPSRYPDFARRLHRWIRGDWQLIPWFGRHVPGRDGTRLRNDLSPLDRWKILDNLRRSLIAPTLVLPTLPGWLLMPGLAWLWTLFIVPAPVPTLSRTSSATCRAGVAGAPSGNAGGNSAIMRTGGRWKL